MGRHSAPDADEEQPQSPLPAETQAAETQATQAQATQVQAAEIPAAQAQGARGDLQLLRTDTRLRLRCAGAVVLIFLVFTSVLILMGRTDVYPIWVWIPTVLSGITIGALLDNAHRARP